MPKKKAVEEKEKAVEEKVLQVQGPRAKIHYKFKCICGGFRILNDLVLSELISVVGDVMCPKCGEPMAQNGGPVPISYSENDA